LGNESVQVGVSGSLDVEGSSADIVDGFVVEHDGNIGVLKESVSGEDGVVWFNNSGGDLGRGVDGKSELGFFTIVDGQSLEEEGSESRTCTTTNGVEDEETLETGAVIGKLSDSVEAEIDDFFTDGVVTTGVVVGSIFLSGDELLGVEELSVSAGSDLIDDGGFEIKEYGSWYVFAGSGFGEEGVEGIVFYTDGLV